MNITMTGNLGSGKSSVCKELANMGFEIISTGNIFREIANEKNVTVIELNEMAKKDRSVDDLIDNRTVELGKTKDNVVFDSRLAWNFIPDSFKIFLLVESKEAARRVYEGNARSAEEYDSLDDAEAGLNKRADLEAKRFKELYGVNYYDLSNYDLVIESTCASPAEIANEIVRNFNEYKQQPFGFTKVELNLQRLYPTQAFEDFNDNTFDECLRDEMNDNSGSSCCMKTASLAVAGGRNYIQDGHEHIFAAIKAGKKFIMVKNFVKVSPEKISILNNSEYNNFEEVGNFRYKDYPCDGEVKGYNADFSNLEG